MSVVSRDDLVGQQSELSKCFLGAKLSRRKGIRAYVHKVYAGPWVQDAKGSMMTMGIKPILIHNKTPKNPGKNLSESRTRRNKKIQDQARPDRRFQWDTPAGKYGRRVGPRVERDQDVTGLGWQRAGVWLPGKLRGGYPTVGMTS